MLGLRTEERVEREKKTEAGGDLFRGRRDLGIFFWFIPLQRHFFVKWLSQIKSSSLSLFC
jgi:hypothetical protein